MEQSPCWEANQFSASQEIPHILWNPKVHNHIHKCQPPVPVISKPLTYIYNCSLTTGIFLERCKFAIVLQKWRKNAMSNYRSVALLIALSKILEIILFKRLGQHLESNNSLAIEQFGFRKLVNTESGVFTLTDHILTSLNQWHQTGLCLLRPDQSVWLCQTLYPFE